MTDECSQIIERKEIVDLFPNLELEEVFKEYSHLSTDALVHLILERRNQIPVKKKTPGFHTRIFLKTYNGTLAAIGTITNCIPNWLGGRIFCNAVKAFEYKSENNRRFYGLKETLECCVCWEDLPINEMCFCDSLVKPGFSKNNASKEETHNFCRSCLEQHAVATMEEMPLAKGGLGLRCMMIDCENPITFQEIGSFISANLMKKLEEKASELCVIQAALNYMERCKKCNCAVELGKSPQQLQIFTCPEKDCKYKFCRLCEEQWDEEHKGISCEEFIRRNGRARFLEKRLSEAVFRNCPKCKLAFVKWDGCNKITCKCGQTQCYICRKDNIGYDHFCKCLGSKRTSDGNFHCKKCNCDCLLWENATPVEKRQMEQIRAEVAEEEKKKAAEEKKKNKP